jgi:hypothetical protein
MTRITGVPCFPEIAILSNACCDSLLASSGVRMIRKFFLSAAVAILMSLCQASSAHAAAPEEQLIDAVKVALGTAGRRKA